MIKTYILGFIWIVAVRVAYSMSIVRKHNKNGSGNGTDNGRHCHEQGPLCGLERWVEALDSVRVEQGHDGKHDQREKGVHKVSETEFVRGQVDPGGGGGGPEAFGGGDAVMYVALIVHVAIGEGGEAAGGATGGDEEAREVLVDGVALAVVREEGVKELEGEDGARREELDEVADAGEGGLCGGF